MSAMKPGKKQRNARNSIIASNLQDVITSFDGFMRILET
jgi:hypothetical protein